MGKSPTFAFSGAIGPCARRERALYTSQTNNMDYIKSAIKTIQNNMHSYLLFLLVHLFPFIVESSIQIGEKRSFLYSASWLISNGINLFILSGLYYHFIQKSGSGQDYLSELYLASKKYFFRILAVTLWICIVITVITFITVFTLKILVGFYGEYDVSANSFSFIILQNALIFLVSVYFVYSIPSIYSHDLSETQAINLSFKFLRSQIYKSRHIIVLLGISISINAILMQSINDLESKSVSYWIVILTNIVFTKTMYLIVLISAVLILKNNLNSSGGADSI
ncbi:MAG: hypothetical protein PVH87_16115 [Desulfobacteraceae bacterium]